jgi:hypothetical protein
MCRKSGEVFTMPNPELDRLFPEDTWRMRLVGVCAIISADAFGVAMLFALR